MVAFDKDGGPDTLSIEHEKQSMAETPDNLTLFEVTDPRGRTVRCTKDCWTNHVLAKRRFMEGWEDDVAGAIRSPVMGIFRSPRHEARHIYYALIQRRRRLYLKVVVEFPTAEGPGEVVTAFPVSSMPPGEKLIWPESSL